MNSIEKLIRLIKIPKIEKEITDARTTSDKIVKANLNERINSDVVRLENIAKESNTEIVNARVGVDGNNYESLNNRIKHEVDQLQTQISDASNLPFTGEYISAEHSVKGVCKDMIVKGKTVKNVYTPMTDWGMSKTTAHQRRSNNDIYKADTNYTLVMLNTPSKVRKIFMGGGNGTSNRCIATREYQDIIPFRTPVVFETGDSTNINIFLYTVTETPFTQEDFANTKIMILEGTYTEQQISSMINGYFEGVKSVSETSGKISILSCGKNLNPETQIGNLSTNTGSEIKDINWVRSGFIRVVNGKNYILSLDGVSRPFIKIAYNMNKEFMYKIEDNNSSQFTPTHNGYIRAVRYKDGGTDYQIQCEEGTQATLHEPYREDKRDISLPNGLREWDSIDFNSGEVVVGTEITRMTSNDEISYISELTNTVLFRKAFNLAKDGFSSICNNFKYNLMYTKDEEGHYLSSSSIYIRINKTKLVGYSDSLTNGEKINLFKTWLQANPTTIYFQLATPIRTKVQGLDALSSYNSITHVFASDVDEISPNIECKIPCNTPAVISTLSARNTVLQSENNTLKSKNTALEEGQVMLKTENEEIKTQLDNQGLAVAESQFNNEYRFMVLESGGVV